jgi:hypothetical protein
LLLHLALLGAGITAIAHHFALPYVRTGELEPVLHEWALPPVPGWAVFPGRRPMPARMRAFLDALEATVPGPVPRTDGRSRTRAPVADRAQISRRCCRLRSGVARNSTGRGGAQ